MKTKELKTHLRDIRLYGNAGMSFPVCCRNAELLDLKKSMLPITAEYAKVTCRRCRVIGPKLYPWASWSRTK